MSDIVRALGFDVLPTAIIVALCGALAFFLKREFARFGGKMDVIAKDVLSLRLSLDKNNELTSDCAETSRLLLLEKMRIFVSKEKRSADKDAYFKTLYKKFEHLGNGDDGGLLAKWNEKPLES